MLFTVNAMKELFLTIIMKPPEVIVNIFSVSVSVSFFFFPCSKGQVVRAYLDTIMRIVFCYELVKFEVHNVTVISIFRELQQK